MRVYLCGPITNCTDEEAMSWRNATTKILNTHGITCLNPMLRDYRDDPLGNLPALVEEDKIDIELSDVVLVNYYKPSIGTSMEILLGWQRNKRVIVVAAEGIERPAWLVYHTHNFYTNFADAYDKILELNKQKNTLS